MKKLITGAVAATIIGLAQAANAATLSYSGSLGLDWTNWTKTLSVSQFDSSLGTLNSVTVELTGHVEGRIRAQNLSTTAATAVDMDLKAVVSAEFGGLTLVETFPLVERSRTLDAYNGTDPWFTGVSSFTSTWLLGSDSESASLINPADLSGYIGSGTVDFVMAGQGVSSHNGGGNLLVAFQQKAGADLTVTYDYTPATVVPLPAAAPLLLGGVFVLGGLARRRNKAA